MTLAEPAVRRFTRDEYHRMAEIGMFEGQRVELIDGEVITMAPQHEPHARAIMALIEAFSHLPHPYKLRCQMPLSIGNSEPEPDIAIVTLPLPKDTPPHAAALVIEVAGSSLSLDRNKAHLYASGQIGEYWIVNLVERVAERFAKPVSDVSSPYAAKYADVSRHEATGTLVPIHVPVQPVALGDIFSGPR